jgi:hypothetical protein
MHFVRMLLAVGLGAQHMLARILEVSRDARGGGRGLGAPGGVGLGRGLFQLV